MYAKKPNIQFPICTVGLYVSLCLMIFLCPFLHCKALRTAMYKRYINYTIIIITKLSIITWAIVGLHVIFFLFRKGCMFNQAAILVRHTRNVVSHNYFFI